MFSASPARAALKQFVRLESSDVCSGMDKIVGVLHVVLPPSPKIDPADFPELVARVLRATNSVPLIASSSVSASALALICEADDDDDDATLKRQELLVLNGHHR